MPCDYKKYHPDWKSVIRPAILARAGNKCEICNVPNKAIICRGSWGGFKVWQDDDGGIYSAQDGSYFGDSYVGDVWHGDDRQILTKIVLTIAHLDHDCANNDYSNLKALCQRCHLLHDKHQHAANSKKTINKKKGLQELPFN